MATTQAMRVLKQKKAPFEVRTYDHKVKGAEFAAEALDWPLEAMVKTLVAVLDDSRLVLACLPGTTELSLKQLAREAGAKSARMSTPDEAEKATGYRVGGISPFGTKKRLDVWLDKSVQRFDRIAINGGQRGTILILKPQDAIEVLGAKTAALGM